MEAGHSSVEADVSMIGNGAAARQFEQAECWPPEQNSSGCKIGVSACEAEIDLWDGCDLCEHSEEATTIFQWIFGEDAGEHFFAPGPFLETSLFENWHVQTGHGQYAASHDFALQGV